MERRRLEPSQRRDELIEFGRHHFAEHAFDALSVDEIATLAGVSKGTIYNYFGGRRGFYVATISAVIEQLLAEIEPSADTALDDLLPGLAGAFIDYAKANAGIYLALVRGGLGADDEVRALLDRVRDRAAGHILAALDSAPSARARLGITGWVAFVEAATASWLETHAISRDALIELFTGNLLSVLEFS